MNEKKKQTNKVLHKNKTKENFLDDTYTWYKILFDKNCFESASCNVIR